MPPYYSQPKRTGRLVPRRCDSLNKTKSSPTICNINENAATGMQILQKKFFFHLRCSRRYSPYRPHVVCSPGHVGQTHEIQKPKSDPKRQKNRIQPNRNRNRTKTERNRNSQTKPKRTKPKIKTEPNRTETDQDGTYTTKRLPQGSTRRASTRKDQTKPNQTIPNQSSNQKQNTINIYDIIPSCPPPGMPTPSSPPQNRHHRRSQRSAETAQAAR